MINLLEPFQFSYMNTAMIAATIVGILCAVLSVYLILKGWSLIGDALSHAVVPGVATAYCFQLPYLLSALIAAVCAALTMLLLKTRSHVYSDAIIAFVLSLFFALGLLIISINPTAISLDAIIYGQILTISSEDLWQLLCISCVSLCVIALKWQDFMLIFFDETQAFICGLNCRLLRLLFFILLTISVVISLQAVGALLVTALMITPAATAYLCSRRFGIVLIFSAIIGGLSGFLGSYLSYFLHSATAPLIVVIQTLFFVLVFLFTAQRDFVVRRTQ